MSEEDIIPDFSGDDFADDKAIQKQRAAHKAWLKELEDARALILHKLQMQESSHKNMKGFMMFKNLVPVTTASFKTTAGNRDTRAVFTEYAGDEYLFGYLQLTGRYPRTYIHPEYIRHKIEDAFLKRDLDFRDHKKFSNRFQVLTENKDALNILLNGKNLDSLALFREMELEITGNTLLYRASSRPFCMDEAGLFCTLTNTLREIFP